MHQGNRSGAAAGTGMSEQLVACLEATRTKYDAVRRLGWRARNRIADARMDLAVLYLKAGKVRRGIRALVQAVIEYPPQLLGLARFAWRFLARRSFA